MSQAADARTDLVRACLREPVSRTPVWFMRQAGRALPEYRAVRGSGSILSAFGDASLSAEVTLQPVRRYGVDAAILFSDIVVPLHAIGFGVDVEPGRGPVVAEPFRGEADLARLRPFEPALDAPYVAETVGLVRRELAGSGVALIGFAGAPFTVASYAVEGGPSRTFAKVKALMHGDPDLWQQLTERLAAMAVASLRAQIEAGAQAVQLFDSWAGSLAPGEYARFALPATRAVLAGIADLGVPTILFGVGTGELLGLMGSAGSDVVGVDWRVPLDEARRRVGAGHALQGNLDPALCLAPWPVVAEASRAVLAAAADGSGTGHIFNLGHGVLPESDPGILAAVVELVHAETRAGMTTGVLLMAHGTPATTSEIAPFYTRIRRGRPPTPEQLADLEARYAAIGGVSPLALRTAAQVDAVRAELEARAPGRYVVSFGAKHTDPLIEESAALLGAAGLERVIGLVLTPHGSSLGSQEYLDRAEDALGATPFVPVAPWYASPSLVTAPRRPRAGRTARRHGTDEGDLHGALAAASGSARPATPIPSSWPSRPGSWRPRPDSTTGWWPGRARDGPPNPGSVPTCATSCGNWRPTGWPTPSSSVRSGSWPTTSRCSTTSMSKWRASRRRAASATRAPHRSTTTPPSSPRWPT